MEDLIHELMSRYLERKPAKEWLYAALFMNYDSNEELLRWMVSHLNCEKAVALAIYWYLGPRWWAQYASREDVPNYERDSYDLVLEIEQRYVAGSYSQCSLAFDPVNDRSHAGGIEYPGQDWTKEYEDRPLLREIPGVMKLRVEGHHVDFEQGFEDWDEGMPPEVWDEYLARINGGGGAA
jgi:hypothetical protein